MQHDSTQTKKSPEKPGPIQEKEPETVDEKVA